MPDSGTNGAKRSLLEELPEIARRGRKEADRILERIASGPKIGLQTNELVTPHKDTTAMQFAPADDADAIREPNRLIYGDNLLGMEALLAGDPIRKMPSYRGRVDLIYIDPPFDSKADYRTRITLPPPRSQPFRLNDQAGLFGDDQPAFEDILGKTEPIQIEQRPATIEQFAYSDTWSKGTASYLEMMYPRLVLMRELLSEKGSIYVHIDWHVGHYVKLILDDIFGKVNFRNEIIWYYADYLQGNVTKGFPRKNDFILFYSKTSDFYFRRITEQMSKVKMRNKVFWNKDTQKMDIVRDENGKIIYEPHDEKYCDTVWKIGQTCVTRAQSREYIAYDTQKPSEILRRIIEASSPGDGLVADFFVGCGTTAAVAEKLRRRRIACYLGKPAVMITRKRLVDIDAKPFLYQSVGDYQRETFGRTGKLVGDISEVVLGLYGAIPFAENSPGRNVGYLPRTRTLVIVDSPNRITGGATLRRAQALRDTHEGGWEKVVVLGWNFASGIAHTVEALNDPRIDVLVIPPDLLQKLKKLGAHKLKEGEVRFSSLQYLTIKNPAMETGQEEDILTVELDNYVLLSADAIPTDEKFREQVQEVLARDPLDLIEYWSIDPDYDGDTFRSTWQDYRENTDNDGDPYRVTRKAVIKVPKKQGRRTIAVRAVDVFGWESEVVKKI